MEKQEMLNTKFQQLLDEIHAENTMIQTLVEEIKKVGDQLVNLKSKYFTNESLKTLNFGIAVILTGVTESVEGVKRVRNEDPSPEKIVYLKGILELTKEGRIEISNIADQLFTVGPEIKRLLNKA